MKKGTTGKIFNVILAILMLVGMVSMLTSCGGDKSTSGEQGEYSLHDPLVRFKIATTTSLYDSGLWYYLEPLFEEYANVEMDIIYAGTGIALEYGRRGDVDAVIVHDKAAEDLFIEEGYGINRRNFAYNFFLIAGPESDPAGIIGCTAAEAFTKIYEAGMNDPGSVKFVSRGDNSGTHSKEKLIWSSAGFDYATDIQGSGDWYVEAGKGMGPTLLMANEMNAYVLADISTYLSYTKMNPLDITLLVEKDSIFLNVYAAIAINPESDPGTKIDIANMFINWLISDEVQVVIATYGLGEYGRSLFNPIARGQEDGSADLPGFPPVEAYTEPVPSYTPAP